MDEPSDLDERLQSPDPSALLAAVQDAIALGPQGELSILRRLTESSAIMRPLLVAALGDTAGDQGADFLRSALAREGEDQDVRCAAIVALAKRVGADASPDLLAVMRTGDQAVKFFAIASLAAAGNGSGWDDVFQFLAATMERPPTTTAIPSPVAVSIAYLGQFLSPERTMALADLLRGSVSKLSPKERQWLLEYWPQAFDQVTGHDLEGPDALALRRWARATILPPMKRL